MKRLSSKLNHLKYIPKNVALTLIALTMIASAVIIPGQLFAQGGPSRTPLYANNPPNYVVFNSIVDNTSAQNPTGFVATTDERSFMQIRDSNTYNYSYNNSISITPGHQYVVYMYYHNDANSNLNLNATGAYVMATIPTSISNNSSSVALTGYIGANNAYNPAQVYDNVYFSNTTGNNVSLSYVPGSAVIHNQNSTNGQTLSDNIVTSGAPIGYNSLNGVIPSANITYGGYNYGAGYVTFKVQASQQQSNNFTISKQVNNSSNSNAWGEDQTVNPGDTVNFQVTYTNNSYNQQNNITISDLLANGLTYVPNSTTVSSTNNQTNIQVTEGINTAAGVNIGSYAYGTTVYIRYSAKVVANDSLPNCGSNTITSTAQVNINGTSAQDTASVIASRYCAPTPATPAPVAPTVIYRTIETNGKLPVTGPTDDIAAFLGLGALVTALGYYLTSRRKLASK